MFIFSPSTKAFIQMKDYVLLGLPNAFSNHAMSSISSISSMSSRFKLKQCKSPNEKDLVAPLARLLMPAQPFHTPAVMSEETHEPLSRSKFWATVEKR